MAPKMQLSQLIFQYSVCSEIHHHIFIIVSSFCQGSLRCAADSQDSKEVGCIIVDRCIDFLNIHGLLAFYVFLRILIQALCCCKRSKLSKTFLIEWD